MSGVDPCYHDLGQSPHIKSSNLHRVHWALAHAPYVTDRLPHVSIAGVKALPKRKMWVSILYHTCDTITVRGRIKEHHMSLLLCLRGSLHLLALCTKIRECPGGIYKQKSSIPNSTSANPSAGDKWNKEENHQTSPPFSLFVFLQSLSISSFLLYMLFQISVQCRLWIILQARGDLEWPYMRHDTNRFLLNWLGQ